MVLMVWCEYAMRGRGQKVLVAKCPTTVAIEMVLATKEDRIPIIIITTPDTQYKDLHCSNVLALHGLQRYNTPTWLAF